MGSMRQLASMIRHVHEAHNLGTAGDSSAETLLLTPEEVEILDRISRDEAAEEAGAVSFR